MNTILTKNVYCNVEFTWSDEQYFWKNVKLSSCTTFIICPHKHKEKELSNELILIISTYSNKRII